MFDCMANQARAVARSNEIEFFTNVKDYENGLREFSGVFNLVFQNFWSVFLYYFLFILLVFSVCVGHRVLVIIKRMTRTKYRRLKHFVRKRPLGSQMKKIGERKTTDCYRRPAISFAGYRKKLPGFLIHIKGF